MAFPDLVAPYQWNFRPQRPRRPAWFTEWPGGARMAVTLILLHEWESTPTIASWKAGRMRPCRSPKTR